KTEPERTASREQVRQEKIEEFRDRFASPYFAAERGFLDAVIQPRETRKKLIQGLEMLETKRDKNPAKKHGNIPLYVTADYWMAPTYDEYPARKTLPVRDRATCASFYRNAEDDDRGV